jgi:hypothetical protein
MYCIAPPPRNVGPSITHSDSLATPFEELASKIREKTPGAAMTTEQKIERLRTTIAVNASHLKTEIELPDVAAGSFDATTKRGALKLLRTAVSAEKHENTAA